MSPKSFRRERNIRTWPERARIFGPAILLSLLALIVTYHFVQPAPPRHIVLATGQEGGAYFLYGLRYQAELAREGIDVTVRPIVKISAEFSSDALNSAGGSLTFLVYLRVACVRVRGHC